MVHFWCNFLGTNKAYKIDNQFLVGFIQRRERDSNPRTREDQQFSRLPHSTTLPSLQYVPRLNWDCKGTNKIETCKLFFKNFNISYKII